MSKKHKVKKQDQTPRQPKMTVNLDAGPVAANWIRILDYRSRGLIHPDDPRATPTQRAQAIVAQQRQYDQERGPTP